ncbi:MAG: type IV pilus secretin PilQ [Deltaproteobacteria bacterium]|nr:type IV pilus secretin PilQ [Deltaproteobacteria bacterium]
MQTGVFAFTGFFKENMEVVMNIKRFLGSGLAGAALACLVIMSGCAGVDQEGGKDSVLPAEGELKGAEAQKKSEAAKVGIDNIEASGDKVLISADGPLKYTVFMLTDPLRVIVDMPGVSTDKVAAHTAVNNDLVSDVTTSSSEDGNNIGRVVIGLKEGVDYEVKSGGNSILVNLKRVATAEAPATAEAGMIAAPAPVPEPVIVAGAGVKPVDAPVKDLKPATKVIKVESASEGENTVVRLVADGAIGNYNSFELDKPARIIVDVWGVKDAVGKAMVKVAGGRVKSVRIGSHPDKVRFVIDGTNAKMAAHSINKIEDAIVLTIGEGVMQAAPKAAEAAPVVTPEPVVVAESAPPSAPVADAPAEDASANTVERVDFKKVNGSGRVVIVTSQKAKYTAIGSEDGKSVIIDIKNAIIPDSLKRTLDASKLKTPVLTISSYQESLKPVKDVRVLVKLYDKTKYDIKEENGALNVDFTLVEGLAPAKTQDELAKAASSIEGTSGDAAAIGETKKVYTGRRINLDMVDVNITDIFRMLAEESDLNIIAADDVKGTISLRLKDVPWDQAFDIILKAKDLGVAREGNVIRVALASKIRQEKESALASKKAQEKLENLEIKFIPINYAVAVEIEPQIKSSLTERGTVTSEKRTNTIIVRDIKKGIEQAEMVVKKLDTQIPQVLIEARIVEASSSFARDLGIQWGIDYFVDGRNVNTSMFGSAEGSTQTATNPNQQFGTASGTNTAYPGNAKTSMNLQGGATQYAVNTPATGTAGTLGALGFIVGKGGSNPLILDLRLSAGESQGLVKTISRPRITTMDNKEAKIEQGESIPFETTSSSGTSTTFIDANLSLLVTPHITPDGSVLMKIKANRNSIGTFRTSAGQPSINKKESSTEVLVKDGETTVIGGIVVSDKSETEAGIPYLKDIPLLGWLFRRKSVSDTQTELLIFITPTIMKEKAVG